MDLSPSASRPVKSAQEIRCGDAPPDELPVDGDQITVKVGPHEWCELQTRFTQDD